MTLREQFAQQLSKHTTLTELSVYLREFMDDGFEQYADAFLGRAFRMGLELNNHDGANAQKELMMDILRYCFEYIKGNNILDIAEIEKYVTESLKDTKALTL